MYHAKHQIIFLITMVADIIGMVVIWKSSGKMNQVSVVCGEANKNHPTSIQHAQKVVRYKPQKTITNGSRMLHFSSICIASLCLLVFCFVYCWFVFVLLFFFSLFSLQTTSFSFPQAFALVWQRMKMKGKECNIYHARCTHHHDIMQMTINRGTCSTKEWWPTSH